MKDTPDISRREFIRSTGVTAGIIAGSLSLGESRAAHASTVRAGKVIGANDRINFGFVGVGGMGAKHLTIIRDFGAAENVAVVAACDVFEKRRLEAKAKGSLADDQIFSDYRRLLENKDIDAVVVATPDHWHARIAIEAMQAGKHVYVEKPMTRTLDEAFKLYDTAVITNRIVQVGSHGCSDPKWHRARDIVKECRLGQLLWAQGSYCRNSPKGEWNYKIEPEATPEAIDWKAWLGAAPKREFSAERFYRWRKYWDYGTGIIGDLWPHRLHPLMMAMRVNEFPKSVSCIGRDLCRTDKDHGEPREVADTTMMMAEFPSGVMIFLAGATSNERGIEDIIRGQKGNLLFGGGKVQVQPERPFVEELEAKDETPPDAGETHAKHQKNFIESLRANRPPNCDVELGLRVQTVVSMAEESYRKGRMVHFDSARRRMG
jgi:predicted dehydrogenase